MFFARARLLIATLWIGSLWTVGYLVAPTLFATLGDRTLAGTIAGRMFRIEAWLSVFCAIALIAMLRFTVGDQDRKKNLPILWLAVGMLACTLIGYFGLHPFMAALRDAAGPGGAMDEASSSRFGLLHGISSAIYLIQSLLGVALILKLR